MAASTDRKAAAEAGTTVVANIDSPADARLLEWARETGRLVYVGRTPRHGGPSPFCNPHKMNYHLADQKAERDRVCEAFANTFAGSEELQTQATTVLAGGKVLACHCAPLRCHADILAEFVNANK